MRFVCKGCGNDVEPVVSDSPSEKELEDIRLQMLSDADQELRMGIFPILAGLNMDAAQVWFGNQPKYCSKCGSVWHANCLLDAMTKTVKFEASGGFVSTQQGAANRVKMRAAWVRETCPRRGFLRRPCRGRLQVFTKTLASGV